MDSKLPDPLRRKHIFALWVISSVIVCATFLSGLFMVSHNQNIQLLTHPQVIAKTNNEVFGFAPYWSLSKMDNINWSTLTTFAYFSLPINANGTIDRNSYEWQVFNGNKLSSLLNKAGEYKVRKVVTLTQMDAGTIENFLANQDSWQKLTDESVDVVKSRNLDGVNIDFEYIPSNDYLKKQFSAFIEFYSGELHKRLKSPYVTVSVLASSARFNRIYDISSLAKSTDGIFLMAYDYYTPRSKSIGPSAPLYGYNNGHGPYWYDVSTAVEDFLKVADSKKIILGVPYYGWNYPAYNPAPGAQAVIGTRASATTADKLGTDKMLATTPLGGWDNTAKVSWRGYWDGSGWRVVYMEDKNSLAAKYDFAREKHLAGVGIWALGYDATNNDFWALLKEKFFSDSLAYKL
jgi:spore germination protein YaaH